jgi:hypothetical protein
LRKSLDGVPVFNWLMHDPLHRVVRTACGRDQLAVLRARRGALAALRLAWFVAIAAIRDIGKPANP